MAKVWLVDGTVQRGEPYAELPWPECQRLLELDEYSGTEERPKFGEVDTWPFPTYIVVSVDAEEAQQHRMTPGFFVSPLTPDEAAARLSAYRP
jgi:hypothetical protein